MNRRQQVFLLWVCLQLVTINKMTNYLKIRQYPNCYVENRVAFSYLSGIYNVPDDNQVARSFFTCVTAIVFFSLSLLLDKRPL